MTLRWLTIPMAYVVLAGAPLLAHALKSDGEAVAFSRPVLDSLRPGAALYDQAASAPTWLGALADSAARAMAARPAQQARPPRVLETIASLDGMPRPLPDAVQLGALR